MVLISDVRCNQMILSWEENSYYTGPLWYSSSIDEACSVLDAGPENNLCNYNISHEPGKCLKQSAAKRCNERERGDQIKLLCAGGAQMQAPADWSQLSSDLLCSRNFSLPPPASHGSYHRGFRKNVRNLCPDRDNVVQNFNDHCLIHKYGFQLLKNSKNYIFLSLE